MSKIRVLSPLTANMIAAGEVLERPSSAVKELVENSIDAKADRIIVEIEDGGRTLIKVTDNGIGMSRDDAALCFLRHATSKIYSEEDLFSIRTLGFRGEALASISAVSKVTLVTRNDESITGTKVYIEAGEIKEITDIGCNVGTSITVTDLFFNTPARLKFLKSEKTEAAYITEIIEKLIISKPEISFKLIKNKKEVLYSAGDNNTISNLNNIYSKDIVNNLLKIDYDIGNVKIKGYIGNEKILCPNRKRQIFFVNDRLVKNKIFYSAVDEAVKEKVTVSKYPFLILNIYIDPELTDINVHPTKAEIKFTDDRLIYNHIYNSIHSIYKVDGITKKPEIIKDFEEQSFITENKISSDNDIKLNLYDIPYNKDFNEVKTPKFEALKPVVNEKPSDTYIDKSVNEKPSDINEYKNEDVKEEFFEDYKIIGQLFNTYILIEKENKLYLLDQHAAHERLLYDKILREIKEEKAIRQQLLTPHIIKLTPLEFTIVMENNPFFEGLGFEISEFGNNSIMVREIPFSLIDLDLNDVIYDMIDIINENKKSSITLKQEKAIFKVACRAAIKANKNLGEKEQKKLVRDVILHQQANTCPHGRPIFISYEKKEIEKQFKRTN